MANVVFYRRGSITPFKLILISSRQVAHLIGENCSKTPPQLIHLSANELRSFRNQDGTWMRIYFRRGRLSDFAVGYWGGVIEARSKIKG